MIERNYTVPLRHGFRNAARYRKTNRAVATLVAFLKRHMKSDDVKVGQHLNEELWKRGARNPPPRVRIIATKDDKGVVRAELQGKQFKESVKPTPKQEADSLKDRLTEKIAGKPKPGEEKAEDAKDAKPAAAKQTPATAGAAAPAPSKPAPKPAEKSAAPKPSPLKGEASKSGETPKPAPAKPAPKQAPADAGPAAKSSQAKREESDQSTGTSAPRSAGKPAAKESSKAEKE